MVTYTCMALMWVPNFSEHKLTKGKLKATLKSKKECYEIKEQDLLKFAKSKKIIPYEEYDKSWKMFNHHKEEYERMSRNYGKLWESENKLSIENQDLKEEKKKLVQEKENLELKVESLESRIEVLKSADQLRDTDNLIKTMFGNEQETRKTFRKIMGSLHPDRSGDEELFKKVAAVYGQEFK